MKKEVKKILLTVLKEKGTYTGHKSMHQITLVHIRHIHKCIHIYIHAHTYTMYILQCGKFSVSKYFQIW